MPWACSSFRGHEGGVQAVFLCQRLHRQLEGHNVIRRGQRVGIPEVDLMLPGRHFVMAGLDFEAHLFQRHADLAPRALAVIQRSQVEVARLVRSRRGRMPFFVHLEQEELALRPHVETIAHLRGPGQHFLQHPAGIARERRSVRVVYVADQSRNLAVLGPPGQDRKGVQVGMQVLVALVDPDKALDAAAVDHDLVIDRFLDLAGGDRHVFQLAEDIGKLHPDEFHIVFPYQADNVFLRVLAHDPDLPNSKSDKRKRARCIVLHDTLALMGVSYHRRFPLSIVPIVFLMFLPSCSPPPFLTT